MEFTLTTTGTVSPVVIEDLGGVTFTHPIVDYPLVGSLGFLSIEEFSSSVDLQSAIDDGEITISDGNGNNILNVSQAPSSSTSRILNYHVIELQTDVQSSATEEAADTLLSLSFTPEDNTNNFLITASFSGDTLALSRKEISIQIWYGLTGSENPRRSTSIYTRNEKANGSSITTEVPKLGVGEHTFTMRWGVNNATIRCLADSFFRLHHATLSVLEAV